MGLIAELSLVFLAGLFTAIATGLGAIPFFIYEEIGDRWNVFLWGLASGIMVAASIFGLLFEGLVETTDMPWGVVFGVIAGVGMVIIGHEIISGADVDPREYEAADFKKLVLILGVLTVHSFPEGVAVGVAFADLPLDVETGITLFSFTIPLLAVFMTVAISIHNIPEGTAIAIPLRSLGVDEWRMVWWAVFSSLPQPIGAVLAYGFVTIAREFLPFGFGFAAGAMIYLVLTEFLPEAHAAGTDLPAGGTKELGSGVLIGVGLMTPLAIIQV